MLDIVPSNQFKKDLKLAKNVDLKLTGYVMLSIHLPSSKSLLAVIETTTLPGNTVVFVNAT